MCFALDICPEPDCVALVNQSTTVKVDFGLRCLPTPSMDCQYNYTVEFYPLGQDVLLASDSQMLSNEELNQTSFMLSPMLLREGTESFEMGVVINVTVFRLSGGEISGQLITEGG